MPAVKKVPLRRCVGCREMKSKKELLRVVRREDGTVVLDPGGRMNGRGANLCRDSACLARAAKAGSLEKSLHARVPGETLEALAKEMDAVHET